MKVKLLGLLIIIIGLLLILDELALVFPFYPFPLSGWLLGDNGVFHIEPFHHWMLGVPLIIGGLYLCKV